MIFQRKEACQLLKIKRSQLYDFRKRWLKAQHQKRLLNLVASGKDGKHYDFLIIINKAGKSSINRCSCSSCE